MSKLTDQGSNGSLWKSRSYQNTRESHPKWT